MIGIIIEVLLSYVLLRIFEQKNLIVLGFTPVKLRLPQILSAFLLAAALCALDKWKDALLTHIEWNLNPLFTLGMLGIAFWWVLKAVLYEDLIFRGALLYIANRKLGEKWAIILSAVCFGVYHWFSYGLLGNPVMMIIVFIVTGTAGWIWAWSFVKTRSMALGFGLHLGYDFTEIVLFSKGPLGKQLLVSVQSSQYHQLIGLASLISFILPFLLLNILSYLLIRYCVKKQTAY
ncbi:hypothetical protein BEL04_03860 [Mucilaginibacter sp. PPCGB 2223]|uniref:CPBP family intramembrane glutamic endopeptidase n=1 Tax=Mucilaginibacter sp. PPCGB 2223 TaxID=1886027 RepID=UPI0008258F49|nr:CPBP family intramembrane glutamic endopeptidase [Mucilaginibacter sp. PPCGB 2223]OCX53446.1 hypothetical protein BEL04_03860 [Mucilaginibacter sp. PPCGB 2223]